MYNYLICSHIFTFFKLLCTLCRFLCQQVGVSVTSCWLVFRGSSPELGVMFFGHCWWFAIICGSNPELRYGFQLSTCGLTMCLCCHSYVLFMLCQPTGVFNTAYLLTSVVRIPWSVVTFTIVCGSNPKPCCGSSLNQPVSATGHNCGSSPVPDVLLVANSFCCYYLVVYRCTYSISIPYLLSFILCQILLR